MELGLNGKICVPIMLIFSRVGFVDFRKDTYNIVAYSPEKTFREGFLLFVEKLRHNCWLLLG